MLRLIVSLVFTTLVYAQATQAPNPTQKAADAQTGMPTPIFRVTVVARTTKAINYHHRSGSTMVDFRGTQLMPLARGEAKVESKQGVIKIDASMEKLEHPVMFGPEYTTYVLWAITPEGRATNVGEVVLNGNKSKLNATSELQVFGLIVTAEPYFAVTQPSDVVVMENFVRKDTTGTIEEVNAKYELLRRGQYTLNVKPEEVTAMRPDPKVPLELHEARNAVRIARWTGAERYASDTYAKAVQELNNAESYLIGKGGKKPIGTVAREAVQMAEDARIITLKKMEEEELAKERADASEREARAKAETQAEAGRREQAEAARRAANERAALEARSRAQAESERASAERAKADADRARLEAESAKNEALQAANLAAKQKAEAEAASQAALAQQQESDRLRRNAENDREQLRRQLLQQLNLILETRDTARGLIVNMSDVLFDTASHNLRPGAREKLAKVSGIVLAHPGLHLEVEGHTDSVGGDSYNQKLSEARAGAVRDYLVQQGISAASVASHGFGETMPVASNDNAAGRQRNRRVELVVSGEVIGTRIGSPTSMLRQ